MYEFRRNIYISDVTNNAINAMMLVNGIKKQISTDFYLRCRNEVVQLSDGEIEPTAEHINDIKRVRFYLFVASNLVKEYKPVT